MRGSAWWGRRIVLCDGQKIRGKRRLSPWGALPAKAVLRQGKGWTERVGWGTCLRLRGGWNGLKARQGVGDKDFSYALNGYGLCGHSGSQVPRSLGSSWVSSEGDRRTKTSFQTVREITENKTSVRGVRGGSHLSSAGLKRSPAGSGTWAGEGTRRVPGLENGQRQVMLGSCGGVEWRE